MFRPRHAAPLQHGAPHDRRKHHAGAAFGGQRTFRLLPERQPGADHSTIHVGAEALLIQNWRVSTDVWNGGIDWKPLPRTSVSFDEFITHYKGNTSWQLTGLNYQLSNGTPVSLGIDLSSVWNTPCAAPFNPNGTVNPTCNGFLAYTRYAPTRTLFPSEQFRFQSASIPHFTMNGRVLYMGTTSHLTNFNEFFNGLDSRAAESAVE